MIRHACLPSRNPPLRTVIHWVWATVLFVGGMLPSTVYGAKTADTTIFIDGAEMVVRMPLLDQWRQRHSRLNATVRIRGNRRDERLEVNLSDRLISSALVLDIADWGQIDEVSFVVEGGMGETVHRELARPVAVARPISDGAKVNGQIRQTANFAAIERGSSLGAEPAPRIPLPEPASLRVQKLTAASRAINHGAITYPVVTTADLPGIGSNNAIVVSRQSFAPSDPSKVSLYFSYRKALFDSATAKLKEWRKMLIEVPLDKAWIDRTETSPIVLPLDRFAIHATEERERANPRWDEPRGYNMLGRSSSGLFQGGQSAEVDEKGRIYISNISDGAGIVRFDPHGARFEQPPLNLVAELRKFIPSQGDVKRNWDIELAQLVVARGRLYVVFDRNYRTKTPNGTFETCSGVVSLPLENWDDPALFGRDLRLHAASWTGSRFPLYADDIAEGGNRRIGAPPVATDRGLVFGDFQLDLDANGDSLRLISLTQDQHGANNRGRGAALVKQEMIRGLPRQRYINVGAAGRSFVRQAYGEFSISRAALALTMPDAPSEWLVDDAGRSRDTYPGAPPGDLTIRFDIAAKLRGDRQRFAELTDSLVGPSQGPNYAVIEAPGEPGQAVAVCEYNYFYSKLDFTKRVADRRVYKTYLPLLSNGEVTTQPASVGLGPYNSTWVDHGNARWLYMPGYTGISRLKYAVDGKPLAGFNAESIHTRLKPKPIDNAPRAGVKDYLFIFPALEGRLIDIGRGRYGRGGGARSAGLELFDPIALGGSFTAVEMNRCYGLYTPVNRLIFSLAGHPTRQEIYVASGNIRSEYVESLASPEERPGNRDPKIFVYECVSGGGLRDLYGFSLPPVLGGDSSANLAFSPCRRYLCVMQGCGTLWTYSLAERRFVDGVSLKDTNGEPLRLLGFSRPSSWLWTAPNGDIFFHTERQISGAAAATSNAAGGDKGPTVGSTKSVTFFRVQVSQLGGVTIEPHLTIESAKYDNASVFDRIVHCFLPDLERKDGSYDLILGGDADNGGQPVVRVVDDFVPARMSL